MIVIAVGLMDVEHPSGFSLLLSIGRGSGQGEAHGWISVEGMDDVEPYYLPRLLEHARVFKLRFFGPYRTCQGFVGGHHFGTFSRSLSTPVPAVIAKSVISSEFRRRV